MYSNGVTSQCHHLSNSLTFAESVEPEIDFFQLQPAAHEPVHRQPATAVELDIAREIARRPVSATERLEAYAVEILASSCNEFVQEKRLYEIVVLCVEERTQLVMPHLADMRGILASIIQDGVASGEFHVDNVEEAAEAVFNALCKFHHPQMVGQHLSQPLEAQARAVIHLVCRGLRSTEALRKAS